MEKIDGQGGAFLSGNEAKLNKIAPSETASVKLNPPAVSKDRVEISSRKKDALLADMNMISRLKKESHQPSLITGEAKQAGGKITAAQDGLKTIDNFAAGFDIPDSYAKETFKNCLPNTLKTTVNLKPDGTTFTITGDIPAMWVRDSCAQIQPYVYMSKDNPELQRVIKGTILRHIKNFNSSEPDAPFVNSWKDDYTPWERKYEPDGVAYLIRLASLYTKVSGDDSWARQSGDFDAKKAFDKAIDLIKQKTGPTGLVKCNNRPSDDETKYPYLIPTNMFLASTMPKLKDMYLNIWNDPVRAKECEDIGNNIKAGIEKYVTYNHPVYGKMWAYEVDDNGNANLMDDANVPSLLSAPYLEFCSPNDPTYKNTRNFVLSKDNPYYYSGTQGAGVGSPHTPGKRVWPLAITMQALTSNDPGEIQKMETYLNNLDAGTHYMHEGVNPDNPGEYSRGWFSWANSLYSEMMMKKVIGLNYYPGDGTYVKPNLNPQLNYANMNTPVPFGNISSLKVQSSGDGSEIVSATINGKPAPVNPEKGIKITEDPADVVIKTKASGGMEKAQNSPIIFDGQYLV
ncbi:MAG: glycoside hydrolase family 125 protein [Firmicutes bacterium]|nr:glycoside hydrolase family 125 protein [Bacillota bacterium]